MLRLSAALGRGSIITATGVGSTEETVTMLLLERDCAPGCSRDALQNPQLRRLYGRRRAYCLSRPEVLPILCATPNPLNQ
jgi:hypothetical protein